MGMYDQIARNKRRTFLMLAIFVLLVGGVAVALGFLFQAGVAIVPWSLTWTLPPVAMFTRRENPRETHRLFTQALRAQYQSMTGAP